MSSAPFLPATLPLLPLPAPYVLFPHLTISYTLPAAQAAVVIQSINENAIKHKAHSGLASGKQAGGSEIAAGDVERMVGMVPVVDKIQRRIGRWATAARIKRITQSNTDSSSFILTIEGLARVRLPRSLPPVIAIIPNVPLYLSTYSLPIPMLHSSTSLLGASVGGSGLWEPAAQLLPVQLHERMKEMPVGLLADVLAIVLGLDWELRVEMIGMVDVDERAEKVKMALQELVKKREGSGIAVNKIEEKPRQTNTATSRAMIKRNPSTPAPPPPGQSGIPDDLQPIHALFTTRTPELSGSAYQTLNRELARLGKIPPQSAEYGVAKTYLELLLSLPWKKVSVDEEIDLSEARKRLEEEHEGLEEVKRRVVEYLAVYRLKKQLYAEEQVKKKSVKSTPAVGDHPIDTSTASEILNLIPEDERADAESPLAPTVEDGPPTGMYRDKGPILLLVGPPGVGKTSIARSLAQCLGRRFHRISLGGVRDEAEIRGHRRTYVGALPGLPVQALRKVGVSNPVILLDELDKISTNSFHGDPSAALLEALDPAQNWGFHDHYLGDVTIDLSQVMFIATANSLDTIPAPLLDRCEVIQCGGYVMEEKVRIAERFLVKKQMEENGMKEGMVRVDEEGLRKVIEDYTRESGVRSLEREIAKLIRSKAVEYSQSLPTPTPSSGSKTDEKMVTSSKTEKYNPEVTLADIQRILGLPKYESELREASAAPGVVHGLSYQGSGMGGVLVLEAATVPVGPGADNTRGGGNLKCTGRLGEVIQESADLALTWVKSNAVALGVQDKMRGVDIHLHLPSGSIKKDGPSAGIAFVMAFVSLLTDRPVPPTTAMTGEITLRGLVTPVGGIKEKVLGAHRAGIKRIIVSERNRKDVDADIPDSIKQDVEFRFVKTIKEALEIVWGKEVWSGGDGVIGGKVRSEARL